MNFGIARRQWKWALLISVCIAGGIAALGRTDEVASASVATPSPVLVNASSVNPSFTLPARQTLGRFRVDPFAPRSWVPPPAPTPVQATTPVAAEPAVPPNPYRFAGTVQQGGLLRVVLAAGERIHLVKGGEVIDELYRVDAVSRSMVTLVYLPLGVEQQLAYATEAAPSPAAPTGPLARSLPEQRP
jgi:hypothetical protein